MTAREAYRYLKASFAPLGEREAEAEAREVLFSVCGLSASELLLFPEKPILAAQEQTLKALCVRRTCGEPLAYLLGEREFYGLRFSVSEDVLIPRQETELLVERCTEIIQKENLKTALDLCTGSGCIAVCLSRHTSAAISASDISPEALSVARKNAETLGASVRFFESDLLKNVEGSYDLIVSNPPYISKEEYACIEPAVREKEPALALLGGADGLLFYRRIAEDAPSHLNPGGHLALEIGYEQAKAVCALLRAQGFDKIEVLKDYAGLERMVFAIWNKAMGA